MSEDGKNTGFRDVSSETWCGRKASMVIKTTLS
jgi:hypothetical protein